MALALPGIMRELMTTVSPSRMQSWRWPPSTMRDRADNGSPCAPVTTSTSCSSGRSGTPLWALKKEGGSLAKPRSRAISILFARDLPLMTTVRPRSLGKVEDFLDALDMAGKKRDDNAALGRIKDLAQRVLDLPLGERTPLAHDVGGVRKQQARAFRTGELPEKTQVRARAAQGVGVELEVAAVHHPAHGVSTPRPKPSGME